jgi:IG-like fold at C-terminal of FixG, putative oxidoreductase
MNATESPMKLKVQAAGLPRMANDMKAEVALRPAEARWVVMAVRVPPEVAAEAGAGSHAIQFDVSAAAGAAGGNAYHVIEKSTFMVPR